MTGLSELYAALARAQGMMGAAKKSAVNDEVKKRYADLAECIEAVREPLSTNGLAFYATSEIAQDGVKVTTYLTHESGQCVTSSVVVPAESADAWGVASAITYGRRYTLSMVTGLAQADDDGVADQKSSPRATDKQADARPNGYEAWLTMARTAASGGVDSIQEFMRESEKKHEQCVDYYRAIDIHGAVGESIRDAVAAAGEAVEA